MTEDFATAFAQQRQALAAANIITKAAVFDALAAAGITAVEVEFDGEGDSGGITEVRAYTGRTLVPLPASPVKTRSAGRNAEAATEKDEPLSDAIETLCYDYLAQEQGGWENDDGGYGTFRFDVAARAIELEFNARFTDVVVSTYVF